MFIQSVLIVHLLLCIGLIGAILLQRSEGGGALGMGGGPSSMLSGRSATNFMTRTTTLLGLAFFVTSITLTMMNKSDAKPTQSLMQEGRTKDGLPTKSIDLSLPAIATNTIAPTSSGIPASSAVAPSIPTAPAEPSPVPPEKK
ncbi:preprotein translocase subunit SecG [Candidatus Phycosocius spiralis]|uniref:Protein-export membrane protein SecG n=1 Tax=Candidatus Phycosocius spiralis TaxID=2815099 RepID=A0ABQ4PT52_9PROT|nr:preprotein translocase subunit SecG [Candidatus Phycosocius spiralis]GIU66156.1 preprotein translocase subunit SecG [Candidatus Phycosocius spiralis]